MQKNNAGELSVTVEIPCCSVRFSTLQCESHHAAEVML